MTDLIRLVRLFAPYRLWMLAGIGLSSVVVLANVALLALSGWFITSMALSGLGLLTFSFFTPAAAIRGLALLRTGARYGERLVSHEATLRLLSELRVWFYRRLEPLAPARLQDHRGGDLLARIRTDIDSLDTLYLRVIVPAATALVCGVAVVTALALVDGRVAALTAAGLVLTGVALPLLTLRLGRGPGTALAQARSAMQAATTDMVRGLAELVLARAAHRQASRVTELAEDAIRLQGRAAWLRATASALGGLGAQMALWLVLVLTVPAVVSGAMAGPDLALLALGVAASFEAVAPLPAAFHALGETLAAARRIFALVDAPPAVTTPATGPSPDRFDVAFHNVSMNYGAGAVLKGLTFHVPENTITALVGPSGAGKTTALNLLQRFWTPTAGRITIGGVDIATIPDQPLRDAICIVGQQTHLFNASIRDNVALARPDATEARIRAALDAAGLGPDLAAMPHGLDTRVGELGTRLSGGQARRVAIARAFLRDAPILLLDEPTEGLDPATEARVLASLSRLAEGRTVLLVSHRPQTLALAHRHQPVAR